MCKIEFLQKNLQKLFETFKSDKYTIFNFEEDSIVVANRYGEQLEFFENGKVKCNGMFPNRHCKFILDLLQKVELINNSTANIIYDWNEEEKSGYWYWSESWILKIY
jgi:hypothetical protein